MENIYQQAVADAKAVRESAMANAKAAIQEAFEPKIKAMLKKHIVESEDLEEEIEEAEDMKEMYGHKEEGMDHEGMEEKYNEYDETMSPADEAAPTTMDETTLDEILAELDGLEDKEANEELEEAFNMFEAEEEDEEEETEEETEEESEEDEDGEEESEEDEDGEEASEETKVVDITLGDLVDAIKAAMATETPVASSEKSTDDDEISLDEILAELENEVEEGAAGYGDMYEAKKKSAKNKEEKSGTTGAATAGSKSSTGYKNPVGASKRSEKDKEMKAGHKGAALRAAEKETAYQTELKEAKKAITAMRAELNEINLLNAKLLYVNKIFKSKTLTEAQKVKVLNAFDKATTVKEVKNTYSIISESITTAAPKKQLKESYGFASKPVGMAPKGNTMESDPFIARMQKLAGL